MLDWVELLMLLQTSNLSSIGSVARQSNSPVEDRAAVL